MNYSRRDMLGTGAAIGAAGFATGVAAAGFGNPDAPAQGAVTTQANPQALVDPGPQSQVLAGRFPAAFSPPPTTWATCRSSGHRSTTHPAASRPAAGRGR